MRNPLAQIYIQLVHKATLHSGLKFEYVVAYFQPFFGHEKLKKTPSREAEKYSNGFISYCPNGNVPKMWLIDHLYIKLGLLRVRI